MNFEFSPTSINFGTTLESSPTTGINIGTNTFDINKSVIPITETPKNQTLTINDNYKEGIKDRIAILNSNSEW
jgi:hypothetical protein